MRAIVVGCVFVYLCICVCLFNIIYFMLNKLLLLIAIWRETMARFNCFTSLFEACILFSRKKVNTNKMIIDFNIKISEK